MDLLSNYLDKLNKINSDYLKLCELLTYEEVILDIKLCQKLEKEKNQLQPIVNKFQKYQQNNSDIKEYKTIKTSSQIEQEEITKELAILNKEQEILLKDIITLCEVQNAQEESIIVLIQSNNNAEELQNLIKNGYTAFSKQNNLNLKEFTSKNTIQLTISGTNAKKYFINEIGLHKHSNSEYSCTIYVLDNISQPEISFEEQDIKITICRASGAGGQHINTTDSAVKITHIKSGICTTCQSERSQFQNKEIALTQLKEKVINFYQKQYEQHININRTKQYKSINLKDETKNYDYNKKIIIAKNRTISFDSFLNGENL